MPLTRGRILGYDNERLAFGFTMFSGSEEVGCQISVAAIAELVGGPRGIHVDRETQHGNRYSPHFNPDRFRANSSPSRRFPTRVARSFFEPPVEDLVFGLRYLNKVESRAPY
jgi:hypothetical protein